MMYSVFLIFIVLVFLIIIFFNHPQFGRLPRGERLERIKKMDNYKHGKFHNLHHTPKFSTEGNKIKILVDFLFQKKENNRPKKPLPVVDTNLHNLDNTKNLLVWFGHSSYFLQHSGKIFLVDPIFYGASPVSFFNKPFKGTDIYKAEDIPNIDYLIITHDHWDHLDYKAIKKLKDKISTIVCPLGVGEHFEYWGFQKNQIIELSWNENSNPEENIAFYCFPTRHFSGRSFMMNKTLWASFILQIGDVNIYLGGDSGYDTHFAHIAKQFPNIDIAILENGQYNKNWRYIHMLPQDLQQALSDLKAKKVFTFHNSKYALSIHAWNEPHNNLFPCADFFHVAMPMIGEVVYLDKELKTPQKWWSDI